MNTADKLIYEHLNDELTDERFRQLCGWLREADAHVQKFASDWLIHSLLCDIFQQRQVQADALLRTVTAAGIESRGVSGAADRQPTASFRKPQVVEARESGDSRWRWPRLKSNAWHRHRFLAIAVVLLFSLTGAVWTYFAVRPHTVAMLTQSVGCRWEHSDRTIADGALFQNGEELQLADGHALITFASGARLVVEGPAKFTIESESSAALTTGALTATVPRQAVGFAVNTPAARLVDLGTEFAVRVQPDQSFEMHVFVGLVELQLQSAKGRVANAPLRLSEGVAVKYDSSLHDVQAIAYNPAQRMTMPQDVRSVPH